MQSGVSFNLLKFVSPGGKFDIAAYRHAIAIVTTAMEIIVDSAGYPTEHDCDAIRTTTVRWGSAMRTWARC